MQKQSIKALFNTIQRANQICRRDVIYLFGIFFQLQKTTCHILLVDGNLLQKEIKLSLPLDNGAITEYDGILHTVGGEEMRKPQN